LLDGGNVRAESQAAQALLDKLEEVRPTIEAFAPQSESDRKRDGELTLKLKNPGEATPMSISVSTLERNLREAVSHGTQQLVETIGL